MKKIGVFVGRFQPVSHIHAKIINDSLLQFDKLIVVIGSSNSTPSIRNPFNDITRIGMIKSVVQPDNLNKLCIKTISDSNYDFNQWISNLNSLILEESFKEDEISLIGYYKDSGSYWLNYFPQWKFFELKSLIGDQYKNATYIRENFFSGYRDWEKYVPISTKDYIKQYWKGSNIDLYNSLQNEFIFIRDYKDKWSKAPFPPTFVTVDSIVLCKGNALLIKRGRNPGKNLYAIPGGFIDQYEFLKDAAIRELKEETKIDVSKPILENSLKLIKVFDNPYRDPRGRCITHAHVFDLNLKDLPTVCAADDANEVKWVPFGEIDILQNKFYSDHFQILKNILNLMG